MNRIRRTLITGLVAGSLFVAAFAGASAGSIPTGYYPDDPYLIVGPGERLPGGVYDPANPPVIPPEMQNPIPTLPTGPNLVSPGYK